MFRRVGRLLPGVLEERERGAQGLFDGVLVDLARRADIGGLPGEYRPMCALAKA